MGNELFEKTKVSKAYLAFALPVVLMMLMSVVYNMVDTYFIAQTGNTALIAGVSLIAPVYSLFIAFGDIWGLGGSSLIARLLGEKKFDDARHACAFAFWAALAFSLCVTAVLLAFRTPILRLLGADEETMGYASQYYTWLVAGSASIILGLVPNNLLRTEGLSTLAMTGSILGSVINIVLDPIFIFTLDMGASGAAIATVIGNVAADIFYVVVVLTKSEKLSISLKDVRVPGRTVTGILAIGIPASVTNIMSSLTTTVTNRCLLPYGTERIAAMGIAQKVNSLALLVLVGFAFGGQPLIGYNYGAKNKARLRETLQFAYIAAAAGALAFTAVMTIFATPIIRIFTSDQQIVEHGAVMLRYLESGMVFVSVVLISTCVCQSFGKATGAMILSVSRQGAVYAAVIAILASTIGYTGILLTPVIADVITSVIACVIVAKYARECGVIGSGK